MSISIRIPTILRTYTGGSATVELDKSGGTLLDAIESLEATAPGIKARLIDDEGKLRRFINLYINDDDVRFLDGLATVLNDGAQISIVPAVAGG
jgi:molybdopterin converting factor small subunit